MKESSTDLVITVVNGESRLDSRLMAECLGIEHEVFVRTLRKYQSQMEELGIIRFENGVKTGVQRGKLPLYTMLNEDQCIFAMTLSRNSDEVVAFKLALTKAFRSARQIQPAQPGPNHEISARLARTYEFLEPRIPHLYWAIITELHREVRIAELLGKLDGGAFPEISVGLKWAAYARKTLRIDTSDLSTYRHSDPKTKKKKEFPAACYPMSCLQDFRDWFKDIYLPYHCPVYVGNRQKRVAQQVKQLVGASIVYQIEASMK